MSPSMLRTFQHVDNLTAIRNNLREEKVKAFACCPGHGSILIFLHIHFGFAMATQTRTYAAGCCVRRGAGKCHCNPLQPILAVAGCSKLPGGLPSAGTTGTNEETQSAHIVQSNGVPHYGPHPKTRGARRLLAMDDWEMHHTGNFGSTQKTQR